MSCEFILGGQKSGKSRLAESRALDWLAVDADRRAVLIATATAHDEEMRERIRRHRQDRAARVPRMETVEEPRRIASALRRHGDPRTLVVVDCLTLWLTGWLMPLERSHGTGPEPASQGLALEQERAALLGAMAAAPGPIVLVGNEIGLGVVPHGREVRAFVDALGGLNQAVAAACDRVTLMVAGQALTLKAPGAK